MDPLEIPPLEFESVGVIVDLSLVSAGGPFGT